MATKILMSVDEYLRTSFDGSDCEYLDGEIVERNMGELPHGQLQALLMFMLMQRRHELGIRVFPEIRIPINPSRYRIADVAVWRTGPIGRYIPTVPPFLAIEVLSREDRMSRVQPKVREYLDIGVEWIWLVDPEDRTALVYSQSGREGSLVTVLRTENPAIQIPLAELFAELPDE